MGILFKATIANFKQEVISFSFVVLKEKLHLKYLLVTNYLFKNISMNVTKERVESIVTFCYKYLPVSCS